MRIRLKPTTGRAGRGQRLPSRLYPAFTSVHPVPWTESHVDAEVAIEVAERLRDDLEAPLTAEAERLRDAIGSESAGRMYSLAMQYG